MAVQLFKLPLNSADIPMISSQATRAVLVQSLDVANKANGRFSGSEDNFDYNIPGLLYAENVMPWSGGLASVQYPVLVNPSVGATEFDKIFPLRDADENTVLYSPAGGLNYVLDPTLLTWSSSPTTTLLDFAGYQLGTDSPNTATTADVTRAYVAGFTFVCYSRLNAKVSGAPGVGTHDASLFFWNSASKTLVSLLDYTMNGKVSNLPFAIGEIDGIASSNGYLIVWSGLEIAWGYFDGTGFNFSPIVAGEITGANRVIPEDVKGPIRAIIPVAGGFIVFTTKNAVAAFYNASNLESVFTFKLIGNAGGVESFEQTSEEANQSFIYAYTTGGIQKISLNSAETLFPAAADFFGGHYVEFFNPDTLTFERGEVTTEMTVKLTLCGQRFLVFSYGFYPGIYSFALIYDTKLERWGKLRKEHRDCFAYSYGTQDAPLTYAMLFDVSYDEALMTYEDAIIPGGNLTYPRQAIAFVDRAGEISLAVSDSRTKSDTDTSLAIAIIGPVQLTRARLTTVHSIEVEGLSPVNGKVELIRSLNGTDFTEKVAGTIREQTSGYTEVGFDLPVGKTFCVSIQGTFLLSTVVMEANNDGSQ